MLLAASRRGVLLLAIAEAAALSVASAPALSDTVASSWSSSFRQIARPNGLSVLVSNGSQQMRDHVGVRSVLSAAEVEYVLSIVRRPDFPWTVARHKNFPTTDVEVAAVPAIETLLQPHLRDELMPTIAETFQIDASQLILRDCFIIKYAAPSDGAVVPPTAAVPPPEPPAQSSLGAHWDESCFSFVMQLNALDEFVGGGTKFAHASAPLSVSPGEAMVFCGYNMHEGVRITQGERYLLTGFVDLRAPPSVLGRFTSGQPLVAADQGEKNTFCFFDFPSPHLPYNVALLRERYGCGGTALLRALAYAPPAVPYLDLAPLARKCDAWLTHGECTDARFRRFLSLVLGDAMGEEEEEDEEEEEESNRESHTQQNYREPG